MLILVAVTVTVAKDGGLFETARTAKTGTQKEADRENLVAAAVGAYDARSQEVKEKELKQNLGSDWKVENQTNYYKVTSPNGNEFKVNIKNATVEDNNEGDGTTPQEKAEFAGKIYRSEVNKDNIDIIVFDEQENKYVLYEATATEGNGKITELTSVTKKLTDKFEVVTKESDEFKNWLTKENTKAEDKGGTIYNIDSIEEKCIKILDYGEKYYYGFFMDSYSTANIDAELKQISEEEIPIFESAIANL